MIPPLTHLIHSKIPLNIKQNVGKIYLPTVLQNILSPQNASPLLFAIDWLPLHVNNQILRNKDCNLTPISLEPHTVFGI